jgi:hypothetical protein
MYQRFIAVAVTALVMTASSAYAQCGCSASPVYAPVATSYYAPPATYETTTPYVSYYSPPVAYTPAPYVTYYAPTVAYTPAPAPYVSYYAPAAPYVTYYSPSVAVAPVVVPYRVYYGVPGWSIYGTPRVYVRGEPVRNTLRAITP